MQENFIFKVSVSFVLWSLWGIRHCKTGPNSGGLPAPEPVEALDPRVGFRDAVTLFLWHSCGEALPYGVSKAHSNLVRSHGHLRLENASRPCASRHRHNVSKV